MCYGIRKEASHVLPLAIEGHEAALPTRQNPPARSEASIGKGDREMYKLQIHRETAKCAESITKQAPALDQRRSTSGLHVDQGAN